MVTEAKAEINKKIKTLLSPTKGVQVGNQAIHVDPTVLFLRVTVLTDRAENSAKYFAYELMPVPRALFKNNFMRYAENLN